MGPRAGAPEDRAPRERPGAPKDPAWLHLQLQPAPARRPLTGRLPARPGTKALPNPRSFGDFDDEPGPSVDLEDEMEFLAEVLEAAITYDQLNISELLCFEIICRRYQLWEEMYATQLAAAEC